MKAVTALVLTIATFAAAAPSPNGEANAASLDTRQNLPGCEYSCLCQVDGPDGPGVDPDTARCCSGLGGSLENNDSVCSGMNWDTAHVFAGCCGDTGGWLCGRNDDECPLVAGPPSN